VISKAPFAGNVVAQLPVSLADGSRKIAAQGEPGGFGVLAQ
jgi:hypothetical protein